ncbi:hypothetical protein TL16_g10208 [Triparma laevis f. inornata]|uniref:BspA family leucine-rich repeat surface protein n=1 Tax=Triparma laevis f. inornata TaxID=1714386 RepID=A0A9W7EN75_9STRA|nr:hypothetical protein TL16_g10208 [Triparma laevis f. inornata]
MDSRGVTYGPKAQKGDLAKLLRRSIERTEEDYSAPPPPEDDCPSYNGLPDDVLGHIISFLCENNLVYEYRVLAYSVFNFEPLWKMAQISRGFWSQAKKRRKKFKDQDRRNYELYEQVREWEKNQDLSLAKHKGKHIREWDTTHITDISYLFEGMVNFDQDLSGWNLINCKSMIGTFTKTNNFAANMKGWNVGNVTTMEKLCLKSENFNADISGFDVSSVTSLQEAFKEVKIFNADVSEWNTKNVTTMRCCFSDARAFNGPLSGWDTTNVKNMSHMFSGARAFNQNLSNFNTCNVQNMQYMFHETRAFNNQSLFGWDVSSVTNMARLFASSVYAGDISLWSTANVKTMSDMFRFSRINKRSIEENWDFSGILVTSDQANMPFKHGRTHSHYNHGGPGPWMMNQHAMMMMMNMPPSDDDY